MRFCLKLGGRCSFALFTSTFATLRIGRFEGQIGIVYIKVQGSYCCHDIGQGIRSCRYCSEIGHQHSQVR